MGWFLISGFLDILSYARERILDTKQIKSIKLVARK